MTVQDPPLCFGPNVRRGDVFNTDLYKAYTQRGNTVAYVVLPALLLHKGGAILCKGVAQGKADYSQRPKSAPKLYERHLNSNDETDVFFSSPNRYPEGYMDEKTSYDIKRPYSTKASLPHRYGTSEYSNSDLSDASQYSTYKWDHNYKYKKYERPYNDYQASISHRKARVK
ncbi:uncharacterized protein LOC132739195 [Ruditapes philippinarum]|uniref:uncharacterized protein LOC132739195 n=1 Tax=Ruditapes philippinarum TaxID=129788 RepID=UPI00295AC6D5|nr:uncharacterized protein LOC132739195 [Ruditapes philippinarum]